MEKPLIRSLKNVWVKMAGAAWSVELQNYIDRHTES